MKKFERPVTLSPDRLKSYGKFALSGLVAMPFAGIELGAGVNGYYGDAIIGLLATNIAVNLWKGAWESWDKSNNKFNLGD